MLVTARPKIRLPFHPASTRVLFSASLSLAYDLNLSLTIDYVKRKIPKSIDFSAFFRLQSDNMNVEGLTIREIAEMLGLGQPTVKMRLRVAGIKPVSYAGPTAVYEKSALEAIRNVPGRGRPPKPKPDSGSTETPTVDTQST